jgi:Tol biopolymer transport system component
VYSASTDGKQQPGLELDPLTAQPLPGTDKISRRYPRPVFWSPDGRYIGFFADSKLKKMEISGGPAQTLADVPTSHGGSWNREGVIVFSPGATGPLYRVSATGGEVTQLTTLDESRQETAHRWPYFLPDGRHFLYAYRTTENSSYIRWLARLERDEADYSADSNVSYAPPGYLLFARRRR